MHNYFSINMEYIVILEENGYENIENDFNTGLLLFSYRPCMLAVCDSPVISWHFRLLKTRTKQTNQGLILDLSIYFIMKEDVIVITLCKKHK